MTRSLIARVFALVTLATGLFLAACGGDPTASPTTPTTDTTPTGSPTVTSVPAMPTVTASATATPPTPTPATGTPPPTATPTSAPIGTPTSSPTAVNPDDIRLSLVEVASGLESPVYVTQPPGEDDRLFVVEQPGRIRIVRDGEVLASPFLDISPLVEASGSEQGLLGLAFHPEFQENGRFFVYYTAAEDGANTLAEYHASPDTDGADPDSGRILIAQEDFAPNHNGGMIEFGPDGFLYVAMGDGGGGGDPEANGQDTTALLGKILRIDVDSGDPYGIPASNPFADGEDGRPEVWAYGLRNPWRFSFDLVTGDLWIADVGQGDWEEVDYAPNTTGGGLNYGWNVFEGSHCFNSDGDCSRTDTVMPVFEYDHGIGCSVTGGYMYRGSASPALDGLYLYSDYCAGTIWALARNPDDTWRSIELLQTGGRTTSFGEDNAGELYITDDQHGAVYRLVAE